MHTKLCKYDVCKLDLQIVFWYVMLQLSTIFCTPLCRPKFEQKPWTYHDESNTYDQKPISLLQYKEIENTKTYDLLTSSPWNLSMLLASLLRKLLLTYEQLPKISNQHLQHRWTSSHLFCHLAGQFPIHSPFHNIQYRGCSRSVIGPTHFARSPTFCL